MIAKIAKPSNDFYAVAHYNQERINKGEGKIIGTKLLCNRIPRKVGKAFDVFSYSARTKKPVFSVSLTFSPEDSYQLNDTILAEISQEYLTEMGYGKQPFIIYRQEEKGCFRVHILSMRVDLYTKLKINDNFERYRSKEVSQRLALKYKLAGAAKRAETCQLIGNAVKAALVNDPTNFKELNRALGQNGSMYRVEKTVRGLYYYHIDDIEKRANKNWKGADFKQMGFDKRGLELVFKNNIPKENP